MLTLIDRAINAFNAKTEQGAVNDALPFAAVYGLLCAFEHGSTDGIRAEDRSRFLRLFDSKTKEVEREVNIGNDVLIEQSLMTAGEIVAGGRNRQTVISGYMELTDKGRTWARRLNELSGDPIEERPHLVDCTGCNTVHRSDVACPW